MVGTGPKCCFEPLPAFHICVELRIYIFTLIIFDTFRPMPVNI